MREFAKCNSENGCCGLCCTKVEDLSVIVGRNTILKDVNMHIHCGELTAIIGPNGAGKSTLLKALLGQIKHTGQLKFMDSKGQRNGPPLIGYVPQSLSLDMGSPTSVLDLFIACRHSFPTWLYTPKKLVKSVEESLTRVDAAHLIKRRLGALSGGELQRVLLALALEPMPDLLLLDEPVSGIDQNGMEMFYKTVSEIRKNYDLSIILISHDLSIIEDYADRVVLLNQTILCNGRPEEVYSNDAFIKTFGLSRFTGKNKKGEESED